jgi:hypothetical protein
MRASTWFYAVSTSLVASAIGYFAKVEYAATAERRILFSRKSKTASAIYNMTNYLRSGVESLTADKPWYAIFVPRRIVVWWRRRVLMWRARRRLEAEFMAYLRHLASKISEAKVDEVEELEASRGYRSMVGVHPATIDARFPVRVELTSLSARKVRDNLFEKIGHACELPEVINFGSLTEPDARAPGPAPGDSHSPLESTTGEPNKASRDPYPTVETTDGDTHGAERVPLPLAPIPPEPRKWTLADTTEKLRTYRESFFNSLRSKPERSPSPRSSDIELPGSGSEYGTTTERSRSPSIASTIKLDDERTADASSASEADTDFVGALPGAIERDVLPSTSERQIAARLCTEEPFEELERQHIYYLLPGVIPKKFSVRGWIRRYTITLDRPELPTYRERRSRAAAAKIELRPLEEAFQFLVEVDAPVPMNRAYDVNSETYWTPIANPRRPPTPPRDPDAPLVARLAISSDKPMQLGIPRVNPVGGDDTAFLKEASHSRTEAPSMPVNHDEDERPFIPVTKRVVEQPKELPPPIDNTPITNRTGSVKGRSKALGLGAKLALRKNAVASGDMPANNSDDALAFRQRRVLVAYDNVNPDEYFSDPYFPNFGGYAVALSKALADKGNLSGADHAECATLVKLIDNEMHAQIMAAALFAAGKKQKPAALSVKAVEIGTSALVNSEKFYLSTYGIDLSLKPFLDTYNEPEAAAVIPHVRAIVDHYGKTSYTPLQPGDAARIHTLDTGSVVDEDLCERVIGYLIAIKAMFVGRGHFPKMRHGQSVLMHPKDVEHGWPEKLVFVGWLNSMTREVHRGPRKTGPNGKVQHEYLSWKAPLGSETPADWPMWRTILLCYPIFLPAGSGPDAAKARD